jgi:hypothetical protein
MIAKEIMNEMPDVDVKLLVCGSEGEKSKNLAMKFVHDENYYVECPQLTEAPTPHRLMIMNVRLKYNAVITAIKSLPQAINCLIIIFIIIKFS